MALGFAVLRGCRGGGRRSLGRRGRRRDPAPGRRRRSPTSPSIRWSTCAGAAGSAPPRRCIGSALAVKPLLTVADGVVRPYERVRTRAKAVSRLEDLAVAACVAALDGGQSVRVAVHHLDDRRRRPRAGATSRPPPARARRRSADRGVGGQCGPRRPRRSRHVGCGGLPGRRPVASGAGCSPAARSTGDCPDIHSWSRQPPCRSPAWRSLSSRREEKGSGRPGARSAGRAAAGATAGRARYASAAGAGRPEIPEPEPIDRGRNRVVDEPRRAAARRHFGGRHGRHHSPLAHLHASAPGDHRGDRHAGRAARRLGGAARAAGPAAGSRGIAAPRAHPGGRVAVVRADDRAGDPRDRDRPPAPAPPRSWCMCSVPSSGQGWCTCRNRPGCRTRSTEPADCGPEPISATSTWPRCSPTDSR